MGRKGVCITFAEDMDKGKVYFKTIEENYNMTVEVVSLDETFEKKVKDWLE